MIGALPAGIVQGLFPQGQMQTAAEPFVYGQGGRRMTPEEIARERAMSARMMQSDYSPVSHWAQGLGRVADGLLGGMKAREADQATAANQAYSEDRMAQLLLNPSGSPSASAPPGAASSSMPGGNGLMDTGRIAQMVLADPYIDANTKALAQMQLEQQQKFAMKQFEYANRELPEVAQLARLANDPAQPDWMRKAAADRITAMNDPMMAIADLGGGLGSYYGPRSNFQEQIDRATGQVGSAPSAPTTNTGDVIPDPRKQGGQSAAPAGTFR